MKSLLRASFRIKSISNSDTITRAVHAAWSVLLSHEWIYNNTNSNKEEQPYTISDEPYYDKKANTNTNKTKTILMIHNHHQNRQHLRKLAFGLLSLSSSSSLSSSYQCLLLDLRGHGDSDIDDYSSPHDHDAAVDDIIDLISSISNSNDDTQPSIIIGNGTLGSSVALSFADHINSNKVSKNTHSEITGTGSIKKIEKIFLLNKSFKLKDYEKDNSIGGNDDDTTNNYHQLSLKFLKKKLKIPKNVNTYYNRDNDNIVEIDVNSNIQFSDNNSNNNNNNNKSSNNTTTNNNSNDDDDKIIKLATNIYKFIK